MKEVIDLESPMCLVSGLDDVEKNSWHQFFHSYTCLRDSLCDKLMATHRLTLFDVLVLDLLAKSDGGSARMSDLAHAFTLIPSRMTGLIHRLESQGLVRRSPSPGDRRSVLACIIREGRARLRPAITTYAQTIRTQYLDQMTRQQMISLGDSCRRINAPLEALNGGAVRPRSGGDAEPAREAERGPTSRPGTLEHHDHRRTASDLPGLDIAEQKSWQNYLTAGLRLWATLDRHLADAHQLSLVDIQLMDVLVQSANRCARMRDLADALAPAPSQLTKRIRRLDERGLVRRESSPDDRRGVVVIITDDGSVLVKQATQTYAQGVRTHLVDPLSRPQLTAIAENCGRILAGLPTAPRSI